MTPEQESEILEEALKRAEKCDNFYSEIFERGRDDQDFVNGINQWAPELKRLRDIDGLPSLVLNQMKPFCNQVINDIRQARPAIRIVPVDNYADPDTAEVFSGIIRNIEYTSKASDAYDTGAKNAVEAGLGWIRVCVDYENEYSFDQDIKIERILNFESAMLDPNSKTMDGSDAEYGFVFVDMDIDDFKEEYPDASTDGFEMGFWASSDTIRVAEYFYKEYEEKTIYRVSYTKDGKTVEGVVDGDEKEILEEQLGELDVIDQRSVRVPSVKWCLMTRNEILESTDWLGKYIPIIPVIGDEAWLEGRRYFNSLIRQGKDAQRQYNYWKSCATAFIALQPKAPTTGPVGSFDTDREAWDNANRKNYATLEWDPVYDENGTLLPPPQRMPPVQGSPSMMQEAMSAREDIRLSIGMTRANMGEQDNAISGIAVRNRQIEGDNATFHFIDNLASSITHLGCILVDLIPKVYKDPQIRRILGQDGSEKLVPINQPFVKNQETGQLEPTDQPNYDGIYDLRAGKYDVVCDVGPSYSTQRQETADKLIELINARPELMEVVGDLVFQALDTPLSSEIAERMKAVMNPEVLGDDPQAQKLQAAAQQITQLQEQLANFDAALQDKKKNEQFEQNYKLGELQLKRDQLALEAQKAQAEIQKMQSEIRNNDAQTQQDRIENAQLIKELQQSVMSLGSSIEIILDDLEEGDQETSEPVKELTIDIEKENGQNE